ncbi:L-saccharopine oxidase, partial [Hyphodiscus hymeniophilus]
MVLDMNTSVLIIGGGAFGTSTAYHLVNQNYKNVKVLDRFAAPSKEAAANDLNKIIRDDYPDPLYAQLAREAMKFWKAPNTIFTGLFRPTGWICSAHRMALGFIDATYQTAQRFNKTEVRYMSISEIKERWPGLTGSFSGWTNLWSPEAGWVPSGQALLRMATAAQEMGATYMIGDRGYVKQLLFDERGKCTGALSADGYVHSADIVILCTGANTAALIDAKEEIFAESHCIGVVQLTAEEAERYKDLPIIDDFEQVGIDAHVLVCYLDTSHNPVICEMALLTSRKIRDGDTKDVSFRICPYPQHSNLYVATAGSGHGFKFMPIIGKYVVDMIEGRLTEEYSKLWSWKFGRSPAKKGPKPHPWPARDLGELDGW